jgi:hypothetical protein
MEVIISSSNLSEISRIAFFTEGIILYISHVSVLVFVWVWVNVCVVCVHIFCGCIHLYCVL